MTRLISILALAIATGGGTVSETRAAQPVCLDASELEATLIDMYGEYPQPGVTRTATAVTQIWASPRTGTWTLVKYLADGTACAVDEGLDFGEPLLDAPALMASLR